jgi:hypothetical protein
VGGSATLALSSVQTLACGARQRSDRQQRLELQAVLDSLERKVCLTLGERTSGPKDQCEPRVDRETYLEPVRQVFIAAPPILKAYLCTLDRLYFDYQAVWNASFFILPDTVNRTEYRSIAVRRGVLENKVRYVDWATGWAQHWWTGGPNDRPQDDPELPRVEIESDLPESSRVLYHLVAHEVAHELNFDYRQVMPREPEDQRFEPGEFGHLSWISPRYQDSNEVLHPAVARDSAVEAVRRIDFDGNLKARFAMLDRATKANRRFDPGAEPAENWKPAERSGIARFLDQLDRSSFTTVFSTWRPDDDWTESFAVLMLAAKAGRLDIVKPDGGRVRVLGKVMDETSPFGPKRRHIERIIERALADFRLRQARSPSSCLTVALAGTVTR